MTISYTNVEKHIYRAFNKYGTTLKFYHKIDGEKNDITGATDYSTLITEVKGMTNNFSDIFVDDDLIQKGDKQLLISVRNGRPSLGDEVLINDTFYKVINIKELSPAGTNLVFELHIRSYALGVDVDQLFVGLADLQLGAVLSDPNRSNTPEWRVVAHDHHKSGVTTLICDKVWDKISFNGVNEVGYASPTAVWSQTYMRRWLHNEFANMLSAKMTANLQGVLIQTNTEKITDTISILSKVELGSSSLAGTLNGEAMPYFEADSFRIAYYDDPKRVTDLSTEYWTREGWGVGADGKFKTYNSSYTHGVRPVIFLRSSLQTVLNYNGTYEVQFE